MKPDLMKALLQCLQAFRKRCGASGEAWLLWLISWLLRGLYATLRPTVVQPSAVQTIWRSGVPALPVFWHGRMLYFLHLYHHYEERITILVSQSKDGERIHRILLRFGVLATRGSNSRGAVRGLLALVRQIQQGKHVCFTPDGPRGPRYRVKPGVIGVARKSGAPILPVTYHARWNKILRSWDDFMIPLPFSRVVVVYGEPIYVPRHISGVALEQKRLEVETSLQHITAVADAYFARKPATA